jgi:hypothetical protein
VKLKMKYLSRKEMKQLNDEQQHRFDRNMYQELRDLGQCLWVQQRSFDEGYLCCRLKSGHEGGHQTAYDSKPEEDQSYWSELEVPPEVELLDKITAKIETMEKNALVCRSTDVRNGYLTAIRSLKKFIDTL